MTLSPTWTSSGTRLPLSSMRPGPTATTSPSWGFSLAVSGITSPEAVVCSASTCWMTMRSSSGLMETGTAHPFVRGVEVRIGTSHASVPAESLVGPQGEDRRADPIHGAPPGGLLPGRDGAHPHPGAPPPPGAREVRAVRGADALLPGVPGAGDPAR